MLIMAAYMSHERGQALDLTDPNVLNDLEEYVPLIQKGEGKKVL